MQNITFASHSNIGTRSSDKAGGKRTSDTCQNFRRLSFEIQREGKHVLFADGDHTVVLSANEVFHW